MKLFLDDERKPKDAVLYKKQAVYWEIDWKIVRSYQEFVDYMLNNEMPELISFDHDLTYEHYKFASATYIPYGEMTTKTGYHCLLWLLLYCGINRKLPEIMIHTMNIQGYNNMQNLIDTYKSVAGINK